MNARSLPPAAQGSTAPGLLHDDTIGSGSAHYRVSRQALAAANATVTELLGSAGSPPIALLPVPPAPRVPVA
jgi:hypothetical protein